MKHLKILIFSLSILDLPNFGNAQTTMTLKECVEHGLSHFPTIQKGRLDIEKANEKTKEVKAGWLPQVKGSAAVNDNLKLATQILPGAIFGRPGEDVAIQFGTKYQVSGGIDVNQVIYNPALPLALRVVDMNKKVSELNVRKTEEQLIYDIASAYYGRKFRRFKWVSSALIWTG